MMTSADAAIATTKMTPGEAAFVHERLMLSPMQSPRDVTIDEFSRSFRLMPMLVARTLLEIRPDEQLSATVTTNEFLIKTFGKNRVSRDVVEGGFAKIEKFWRHNDPLGIYQPGDMFYVDDNHPWMRYFPILVLAPTAFFATLVGLFFFIHVVAR